MMIALASPSPALSYEDGFKKIEHSLQAAALNHAKIVCFPEAYIPGLRGVGIDVLPFGFEDQSMVIHRVSELARRHEIAVIMGSERLHAKGRLIASYVFDASGQLLGCQPKTQIDPSEDANYIPGDYRQLFTIDGLRFGISICHEGWRYPETVRWAASRGAQIVFHPQHTGSDTEGDLITTWGAADSPYYEKAMMMRSIENTIYFASVNYALKFQESATSVISPEGRCVAYLPYGQEGILTYKLDLETATGNLARRWAPERYQDCSE